MALALYDRVQQTGTANTTVSFTLSGTVTGFQSFAVIGNGNTTYYSSFDTSGNWETGLGTYSTTGPTLTRTTVYQSSNSNTAVTFSGTVNVFVTYPSGKAVNQDASGVVTINQLALGLSTQSVAIGQGNASIMKNRIINGAMVIDQRNAGASGTGTSYTVDRWQYAASQASKATWQQNAGSVTPPTGFTNYLGITSSSAYSILSTDYFYVSQPIEGFNIADLGWGSANAKTVTLSFWVRSSLTGTFGGSLQNSAASRSYPFSYTISVANTWTTISITIAGDTSGTWLTTNGLGMYITFGLGVGTTYSGTSGTWANTNYASATGATSVVGTNGATFYITGVQLEKGSVATPFEYRHYGTELNNCLRYYWKYLPATTSIYLPLVMSPYAANSFFGAMTLPVPMRTGPTFSYSALSGWISTTGTQNGGAMTSWTQTASSPYSANFGAINTNNNFSLLAVVYIAPNSSSDWIAFSSEL